MRLGWALGVLLLGATGCIDFEEEEADYCRRHPGSCGQAAVDGGADGGTDGGRTDGGNTASPLILTHYTRYYSAQGVVVAPDELDAGPPELYTLDGGALTRVPGVFVQPGRLQFDVPPGEYVVRYGTGYLLTSERQIELSTIRLGRPRQERVDNYSVQLNLSGMSPWGSTIGSITYDDRLNVRTPNLDERGNLSFFVGGNYSPPSKGSTQLRDAGVIYSPEYRTALFSFDPSQGDEAWLTQNKLYPINARPDGGVTHYEAISNAAQITPAVRDGGTWTLSTQLSPVPSQGLVFEWRRGEFEALRPPGHTVTDSQQVFDIYGAPFGNFLREGTGATSLLHYSSSGETTTFAQRVNVGNPFPSTWNLAAQFQHLFIINQRHPQWAQNVTGTLHMFLVMVEPLQNVAGGIVRPRLSPPRQFMIDGVPAEQTRNLGARSPLVTWEPPATGTVTRYELTVQEYGLHQGIDQYYPISYQPFMIGSSRRQFRIPPGLFQAGKYYALLLVAVDEPGWNPSLPLHRTFPHAVASVTSGFLYVP
jgi:hypothetical protein